MTDPRKNVTLSTMILVNVINFGIVGFWSFDGAVMPLYLTTRFGLNNTAISYILGIGKFMIFMSMFFGLFSDLTQTSWGKRRPMMLIGGLMSAPLIALIPHLSGVWVLVAVLTVVYFGIQFAAVPYFSLVPEVVPNEKLGTANAFFSGFGGVGTIIAYAVLLGVVYSKSKPLAFYILGVLHLVCTLVTVFTVKEFLPDRPPEKVNRFKAMVLAVGEVARDMPRYKDLALFLLSNLLFWLGLGAFVTYFTKFMEFYANIPGTIAGFVLGAIVIVSVLLAVPVGVLGDKISRKKLTAAGMFIIFVGLLIGYFTVGPSSRVSGVDLGDIKQVSALAAALEVDLSAADLSPFVKKRFSPPRDVNNDQDNSDKKSDVMRWCLNGELDKKTCAEAVGYVMAKDDPKLAATADAFAKLAEVVGTQTKGVLYTGLGIISIAAVGLTVCFVIMATILPTLMPEEKMGLYMGFYSTITGLGQMLSILIAGRIIDATLAQGIDALGYRWMFIQGAACLLLATLVLLAVPYIPNADQPTITELEREKAK